MSLLYRREKALTRKVRVPQAQPRSKHDGRGKAYEGSGKSRDCPRLEQATEENPPAQISRPVFPGAPRPGPARGQAVTLTGRCSGRCARDTGRGRPAHRPRPSRPPLPREPRAPSRAATAGPGPGVAPHCRAGLGSGAGPSRAAGRTEHPALPQLRLHGRGTRGPALRHQSQQGAPQPHRRPRPSPARRPSTAP